MTDEPGEPVASAAVPHRPGVGWSGRGAVHGIILAVPATVVSLVDPGAGFALAVGVIPAAAVGLGATRRARFAVVPVGAIAGVSMFLGSLVAPFPVLAVIVIAALAFGVTLAAANPARRLVPIAAALGPALFGAGLSEASPTAGITVGLLLLGGSVYAWLVSLPWPPRPAPPRPARPPMPRGFALQYGTQLALVGAITVAAGFALGADHPGWACTAALLISRPDPQLLRARGYQRSIVVFLGATLACAIALLHPTDAVLAALAFIAVVVATTTAGSRWYILPFFTTLIVISMLILGEDLRPAHWFVERVVLTLLGAAVALAAGWVVPAVAARLRPRRGAAS